MKKQLLAVLLITMLAVFIGCQKKAEEPAEPVQDTTTAAPPAAEPAAIAAPDFATLPVEPGAIAVVKTKFGDIKFEFLWDKAPNHCKNFIYLARQGFYNGTTFHRVVPGFVIQGGCPLSKDDNRANDGTGSPGYNVPAEFNDIPHTKGIVSMARSQDPNSAGSQFFICVADANALDGQYSAFGRVTEGMEFADQIVAAPRDNMDNPTEKIEMTVEIITPETTPAATTQ